MLPRIVPKAAAARSLESRGFLRRGDKGRPRRRTNTKYFLRCTSVHFPIRNWRRERKSWQTFLFITNLCKTENSFNFIKCRNFYVFLINAMLRQLRGHICYEFNEKTPRGGGKTLKVEGGNYE